ncbi:DUF2391 family protein [Flagellimonas sp. HMM57]|uniref:DUF2391 family protein n=1 Tax=unclassified Flagellimonas TaxID=2644544 RepID=UPI0013D6EF23|nr:MULTISPECIES: DUF2391 family protein [unclassified Flagellimonas]UII76674.1 DUF2391 family protein [Flagellimonas sp. HMM57]
MEDQKTFTKRIGGYLHKMVPITDASGKLLHYVTKPLMVELKPRDIMQIIIGSTILALPVTYTEEAWKLGEELPLLNVGLLSLISLTFIALFVYFNFYRFNIKGHLFNYIKRVLATYLISILVVAVLLTIIQRCPWQEDALLAIKRIVIVSFPASMSATISDVIK